MFNFEKYPKFGFGYDFIFYCNYDFIIIFLHGLNTANEVYF